MRFIGRIYRPPSEANSLLIQLTVGCSHNRCSFCAMYKDKKFFIRSLDEVFDDIKLAAKTYPQTRSIFICDGDALSVAYKTFITVCQKLNDSFPKLRRIASYVNAQDILALSKSQLSTLRSLKFSLGYLGLESGSEAVLKNISKGSTATEMLEAHAKAKDANIKMSVIALLGIGGKSLLLEHIEDTANVINAMQPKILSFLTTIILPQTPLYTQTQKGTFTPLTEKETIGELYNIIEKLDLTSTIIRANHSSNLIPIEGRLPKDKYSILDQLKTAIHYACPDITCIWTKEQGQFL